eukprot:15484771-Alexandrium_andersonii.AAC.1
MLAEENRRNILEVADLPSDAGKLQRSIYNQLAWGPLGTAFRDTLRRRLMHWFGPDGGDLLDQA